MNYDIIHFTRACDECSEWFHGKCIKITPDRATLIKRYYCAQCQTKDASLKIKYKKKKDKHKEKRSRDRDSDGPSAKKVACSVADVMYVHSTF